MKKRVVLTALQIAIILSAAALLFTASFDSRLALYINFGILLSFYFTYLAYGRCPLCKGFSLYPLLKKSTYCRHCGELIELE